MLGLRVLLWQSDGLEEKALLPQYLVHGNDGPTSQTDFFVDSLLGGISGLRLPDTAVYPRFSLLRASREAGGMLAPRHLRGGACTHMKMELQGPMALRLAQKYSPPFSQRVTD